MSLNQREIDVLVTIVEDYIESAAPVGSRTVARKSGLNLSAASMRNTMADLTDKGFLSQPHTSAGRVPTAEAFRYYLDTIIPLHPLAAERKQRIAADLLQTNMDMPGLLGQASRLLSGMSNQVSVVLAPSREDVRWREIDFALVKPGLVLTVLIMDGGMVQNKLVSVDTDITSDELVTFANYLNAHFAGKSLAEARAVILQECRGATMRLERIYRKALLLAGSTFAAMDEREVFVGGAVNMFDHAEFADMARMRDILRLLDERTRLLSLIERAMAEDGVKVVLGQEVEEDDLDGCSVVSSTYGPGPGSGAVSVIGPVRMNYAAVVPVVDCIAKTLTQVLKSRF